MRNILPIIAAFALSGCVGSVVKTIVTAPVKVATKAVDVATTSQDEADRNAGRKARKQQDD